MPSLLSTPCASVGSAPENEHQNTLESPQCGPQTPFDSRDPTPAPVAAEPTDEPTAEPTGPVEPPPAEGDDGDGEGEDGQEEEEQEEEEEEEEESGSVCCGASDDPCEEVTALSFNDSVYIYRSHRCAVFNPVNCLYNSL